jgi:hypothetical protein
MQMHTRYRKRQRKQTRRLRKRTRKHCGGHGGGHGGDHRGGNLGRIPASAIVSIQQDAYSPRILVDTETAEDLFEARGPYLL